MLPGLDNFPQHADAADIIICVHNALDDVKRCLESILAHTTAPFRLILIDDGSATPTRVFLNDFSAQHGVLLLCNESAQGYTRAANQGLRKSTAPFVVLLNSDTIVAPQWLDRLIACANSAPNIGMAGPLSNTASWQSIPEIEHKGDWATNPLPLDMRVEQMAARVAAASPCIYPRLAFLNGFCLLIKRTLIDAIGIFDEDNFGAGYGEENDYCIRALQADWELALADDVYIYHAQSKSYSHDRRKPLADRAYENLVAKHGSQIIEDGVRVCRDSLVMTALRTRARHLLKHWHVIEEGQYLWRGKKVIFLLPIFEPGGGGNVVISEALAMRKMGVDVWLLNWARFREPFEQSHPHVDLPVIYVEHEDEVPDQCHDADAVIATANFTVDWLTPLAKRENPPVLAYYIQDFEPYFYIEHLSGKAWLRRRLSGYYFRKHAEFRRAWLSYLQVPNLVRFTKTEWNRREVKRQTGQDCDVVGISYAAHIFLPCTNRARANARPIHIGAMVRPSSERRAAGKTMRVLRAISKAYGARVKITIFGAYQHDPLLLQLALDFPHENLELLNSQQVANLFNRLDIFADFSHFQAMGLTALEAMACGTATIVPANGGARSFARHGDNAWVIDSANFAECYKAVCDLLDNDEQRQRIAWQAAQDVVSYTPEQVALNILRYLFTK